MRKSKLAVDVARSLCPLPHGRGHLAFCGIYRAFIVCRDATIREAFTVSAAISVSKTNSNDFRLRRSGMFHVRASVCEAFLSHTNSTAASVAAIVIPAITSTFPVSARFGTSPT
jgi:hypothetical protein